VVVERILLLAVGGAIAVFAPIMIVILSDGSATAAMLVGISGLAFAVFEHRWTARGEKHGAASPRRVDLLPCLAPDENLSPAMIGAVAQFAPRLLRLTRLVHGRFSQVDDDKFWQSDVILTAYVTGLVAGRRRLGHPLSSPRGLLAYFIGAARADAALERRGSGVTLWTNGLFDLVESIGCMDGVRLQDERSAAHVPALSKERGHG